MAGLGCQDMEFKVQSCVCVCVCVCVSECERETERGTDRQRYDYTWSKGE